MGRVPPLELSLKLLVSFFIGNNPVLVLEKMRKDPGIVDFPVNNPQRYAFSLQIR